MTWTDLMEIFVNIGELLSSAVSYLQITNNCIQHTMFLFAVSLSIKMFSVSSHPALCEPLWEMHILNVIFVCECIYNIDCLSLTFRIIKNYLGDKMLFVKLRKDLNA